MLGKLLKKDVTATARFFIPLIIGYVAASILGKILFEVYLNFQNNLSADEVTMNALAIFSIVYLCLFIIYFVAYYVMTFVFIVYDFYKTMVSDQAYLTHTLPVKVSTLIFSKTINAVFWRTLTGLIILLSFVLFFAGHISMNDIQSFFLEIAETFDTYLFRFTLYMIISIILGAICSPLMFFACIAIGHLFGKHRIIGAILSYLGIYGAMQTVSTIAMVVMGYRLNSSFLFGEFMDLYMLFAILFTLVTVILFYWITNFVFRKKLNLE